MVEDILKATQAYRSLTPIGKRLFREETGLNSVKRRGPGKRRALKAKAAAPTTTQQKRTRSGNGVTDAPALAATD